MNLKPQANFRTCDDERELVPIWEIAQQDRKAKLERRKNAGENVDSEVATGEFFDGIADFVRRKDTF